MGLRQRLAFPVVSHSFSESWGHHRPLSLCLSPCPPGPGFHPTAPAAAQPRLPMASPWFQPAGSLLSLSPFLCSQLTTAAFTPPRNQGWQDKQNARLSPAYHILMSLSPPTLTLPRPLPGNCVGLLLGGLLWESQRWKWPKCSVSQNPFSPTTCPSSVQRSSDKVPFPSLSPPRWVS